MTLVHSVLNLTSKTGLIEDAQAHCDIPCGIYDPATALLAALSVVRLMDIQAEASDQNTFVRCVLQKEEEAEKVKHEVRVIWGDYFKAPQIEKHPQIHELAHAIMQKASACKQGTDRADGEALVDLVNQFAEIFWTTKDVSTERWVSPYPPSLEVVQPAS